MTRLDGAAVVVTGGTGFLGRHVAAELEAAGVHVRAVGRSDYDLRQRAQVERLLADSRPDAVVHLAAVVGGIAANEDEPGRFFYENAVMGIELIECCRRAGVPKVLLAGTVCAYPRLAPVPFREASLWDGYPEETNAPYGLAKKMLLVQAQAYRRQYGMNAIYLLPVNLYGPGDSFDLRTGHVVPALVRRFREARAEGDPRVVLWGDGSATREFLFVEDAAVAFRLALERYDGADPVNVGSGEETSIRDLARMVADVVGFEGAIEWDPSRPNGQPRRRLDTSRAREEFGFTATTSLAEGLRRTVDWYAKVRTGLQP
ncbi:MAG: GDP-L-fucose synthase [Actinomycetota bacterium]|jgi:GDP-L-fucose synthase|nr:GDP-L-fucose synthase [Actinomycetota bacterium]